MLTQEDVRLFLHIDMPETARVAYLAAYEKEPWKRWLGKFHSFLPGANEGQLKWNKKLRAWWEAYAKAVWQRFFWVGIGGYGNRTGSVVSAGCYEGVLKYACSLSFIHRRTSPSK